MQFFVRIERLKLSPAKPRHLYICHLGTLSVTCRQRLELTIISTERKNNKTEVRGRVIYCARLTAQMQ